MRVEPAGVHFAAQGIASGAYDKAVIACGVGSMTRVPLGEAFEGNKPGPFLVTGAGGPGLMANAPAVR